MLAILTKSRPLAN